MKRALVISGLKDNSSAFRGIQILEKLGFITNSFFPNSDLENDLRCELTSSMSNFGYLCSPSDTIAIYISAHGARNFFKVTTFDDSPSQIFTIDFVKEYLDNIPFSKRLIVGSMCQGEIFLDGLIDGDQNTIGVASLGKRDSIAGSPFNRHFFEKLGDGETVYDSFMSAKSAVKESDKSYISKTTPYLYLPDSFPKDYRL